MTLMNKEIHEQPKVLNECIKTNNRIICEVVAAINDRDISNVVIAARGTSDHAAIYGKYIIEYMLGLPVALAAPSILTIYKREMKLKNSLVIGISQSGEAEDVLEVIKNAKKQNALCVSITNNEESPLAKEADYHLYTNAGIEKSVAATKTFTAQMMMIALLTAKWAEDEKMFSEIKKIPNNMKKVLELEDAITNKVQHYRYMEDCFVLARGINYSIALESSLKIQETCYVRAKGYAISDFHHGPFAMIEEGTPVILFAPDGPSSHDADEMIDKLLGAGAEILLVTNSHEYDKDGIITFKIPHTHNDIISPFYNVVWAQMFACNLALSKGLNPDCPRGLKKVTITR